MFKKNIFAKMAMFSPAALIAANIALASDTRVVVHIENLAPMQGTFQTPFWVGFHDGSFDTYNGNTPANSLPIPGSVAMERLCEDGTTSPIASDFATLVPYGEDATLPGPNGPIAPGEVTTGSFILDPNEPSHRYFSYASMVIPSNDFCISNGSPFAHKVFDEEGNFVAKSFFVVGSEVLDAGTEVNDEVPENTAFFGQSTPNTGVDENGVIGTLGSDIIDITGFMPAGSGGILDAPRFAMADFSKPGYPFVKISFNSAPAVVDSLRFSAKLNGAQSVPAVKTSAKGAAHYRLIEEGTTIEFFNWFSRLRNVTVAHLHLGEAGETGPVVVDLLATGQSSKFSRVTRFIKGEITASDLVGPMAGQPLDVLSQAILDGEIYINIHTEQNPSGEIRGQLKLGQ